MAGLVVVLVVGVPLLLWGVVAPRSQWRVLAAWRYRDRDADAPSDVAHGVTRVVSAVLLVLLAVVAVRLDAYAGEDDPVAAGSGTTTRTSIDAAPDLVGYVAPEGVGRGLRLVVAWPGSETVDLPGGVRVLCSSRPRVVVQTFTRVVVDVSGSAQVTAGANAKVNVDEVRRRCAAAAGEGVYARVGLDAPLGDRAVVSESPVRDADGDPVDGAGPFSVVRLAGAGQDGPSDSPSS
ncbi:hypothetical protein [Solicola sp. PLA-1-18]|uniref:hypothetical protein n=1 Tax=Solicola sp. PLA-1-18 TaxID=3380532 RepID=UPI003B80DF5B